MAGEHNKFSKNVLFLLLFMYISDSVLLLLFLIVVKTVECDAVEAILKKTLELFSEILKIVFIVYLLKIL